MSRLFDLLDNALAEDTEIAFGDESTADSFRAMIYRKRRQWQYNNPAMYERYKDIMIRKLKEKPNILVFTTQTRTWDNHIPDFSHNFSRDFSRVPPSEMKKEPELAFPVEGLDDIPAGEDIANKAIMENYRSQSQDRGSLYREASTEASTEATAAEESAPADSQLTYDNVAAKAARAVYSGETLTPEEERILEEYQAKARQIRKPEPKKES